jgi:signal transduction histidine kinase
MYTQVLHKQFVRQGEESLIRSLTKMNVQIGKLTALIEDLLNVSKLEHGKLAFHLGAFNLNEMVKETVEQMQASIRHSIRIEGEVAAPVWGDKERIGQVLTNLLTNAVKYSPKAESVIVYITDEQGAASVGVQDFGIGIAQEHQQHIFDRFYRVNDSEEKTYPGLGIGLHIAHEIIKRHNGTMSVVSEKGQGSLFRFTLPYAHTVQNS